MQIRRREFLGAAAGLAAPFILDPAIDAKDRQGQGPNGRINLGFIGVGMMGRGHLHAFLGNRGVQVVAVCDVHRVRREDAVERVHRAYAEARRAGTYRGCTAYTDFRELIGRRDIDAVVIATPDHWHAIPAILAARAQGRVLREAIVLDHRGRPGHGTGGAGQQHRLPDRQPAAHGIQWRFS